jgi:hypothetical protein
MLPRRLHGGRTPYWGFTEGAGCRRLSALARRLGRAALVASVVVAAGFGIGYYAQALSHLGDTASSNSRLSYADREIGGGNSIVVDQEAAYEARGLIPPLAHYRVVTGGRLKNASSLTGSFVDGWYRSFLIPRRPSPTARWVVCYGCDTGALGGSYVVRWQDDNGISIGEVR